MKPTIQGALTVCILFLIIGGVTARTYLYDNITLNGSRITNLPVQWGSGGSAPQTLDAVTKGYAIENRKIVCNYYAVSNTFCNSGACYATQFNADKVCYDKDANTYASNYVFTDNGATSANEWRGASWASITIDDVDLGSGGGSIGLTGGSDTGIITVVYCCG